MGINDQNLPRFKRSKLEHYEKVKGFYEDSEYDISETYPAQMESAMRAGWNDPAMDAYNDYDANRAES